MKPSSQTELADKIAAQAEFAVDNVRQTDYLHKAEIDPALGTYDCDCSEFVSFVLQTVSLKHYNEVPIEPGESRPRAFKYYDFLHGLQMEAKPGWETIRFLRHAGRGDVVAWRTQTIEKGQDTGHVLILADTPVPDDSGIFTVRVYDSADRPHFNDTRGHAEGQFPRGVGSGFLKFEVDDQGKPEAFLFSPSSKNFDKKVIAIGRLSSFSS